MSELQGSGGKEEMGRISVRRREDLEGRVLKERMERRR